MASEREKRVNAGNRMSRMLEAEEEDDFYKTTYGGFEEEVNDDDYESEASDSDTVDSDFSIDEDDQVKSEDEDDEPKRQKRVLTKAYKEPKKTSSKPTESKPKPKKESQKQEPLSVQIYHSPVGKKSLRNTTAAKSAAVVERAKEREAHSKMLKEIAARKNVPEVRRLTQDELLEEAKLTEQINLKSLENYQRLELEKKKAKSTKQNYKGPVIRYQSVTMPLIEELPIEAEINVDEDFDGEPQAKRLAMANAEQCSRTFITFTDEKFFKEYFPKRKNKAPVKQFCPVTRQPAKYFDPITQTPYANAQAFKIIRDAYAQHLESGGNHRQKRIKSDTVETTTYISVA